MNEVIKSIHEVLAKARYSGNRKQTNEVQNKDVAYDLRRVQPSKYSSGEGK